MTNSIVRARSAGIALVLGGLFALTQPSIGNATSIQVDSTLGTADANSCTLTNAFGAASAKAAAGTCPAGDGNDVIQLPAGASITLLGHSPNYGGSLLPTVTGTLLVVGNGATVSSEFSTCDQNTNGHRLISVATNATLYLNGLTLSNGCASDSYVGGAILANGSLDVQDVTFTNNVSNWDGGAIGASGASLRISNSTFVANQSGDRGGAVYSFGPDATISGSFFSGNGAATGGGALWLGPFGFKVVNSTFTKNTAATGGAIDAGTGTISFSTFFGNNATNSGAAIYGDGGDTSVGNNIFAKSPGGDSGETFNCGNDGTATTTFLYANISDDSSCGNSTVVASESALKFGSVGLHGGTTQTIPLGDGSVAIRAATSCTDADGMSDYLDQRGVARNYGICDVGAFEHDNNVYPISIPAPFGVGNVLISNGTYVSEYTRAGDHVRDFWWPLQPPPLPDFVEAVDANGLTSFGTFLSYNGNALGLYAVQQDTWDKTVYPAWTDYNTNAVNQIAHVSTRWFLTAQISNAETGLLVIENDQQIALIDLGQPIGDLKAGLDGYLYILLGSTIEKFDAHTLQSAGTIDISASLAGNQARSIAVASASELFVYRSDGLLMRLDANGSILATTNCVVSGNSVPCSDIREIAISQDREIFLVPNLYSGLPATGSVTIIDEAFSTGSNFTVDISDGGSNGPAKLVISPVASDEIFGAGFEP